MRKSDDFNISLAEFIDAFPEAIFVKDARTGKIVLVNQAYAQGFKNGDPIGKTDEEIIEDKVALKEILASEKNLLKGKPIYDRKETIIIDAKKNTRRINSVTKVRYPRDGSGEITHILGISRDITGRVEFNELLFSEAHVGCFVTSSDLGGRFETVNRECARIFGWGDDFEKFKEVKVLDLYMDIADRYQFMTIIAKKGYVKSHKIRFKHRKNPGGFIGKITATARYDEKEDKIIGYHGIIEDVTEQEQRINRLKDKIRTLIKNISVYSEEQLKILFSSEFLDDSPSVSQLSPIEKVIYFQLIHGKTAEEIAKETSRNYKHILKNKESISKRTVEVHIQSIYKQLLPPGKGPKKTAIIEYARRNGHIS